MHLLRRLAFASLLVIATSGATCQRRAAVPVPAQCDVVCFIRCVQEDGDTGIRVTGDPDAPETIDELGEITTVTLPTMLRTCDARREACAQCLRRLERAGVILP